MPADISYADKIEMGNVSFGNTVSLPAASVVNENVAAGADLDASKLRHRHAAEYIQKAGSDVVSETKALHLTHGGGDLLLFRVRVETAPTGGDKAFTVDMQKAVEGSVSWTTVLSAVVTVDSTDANGTTDEGTISAVPYNATDAFRIVVTASGSTGAQGQGLHALALFDERAA